MTRSGADATTEDENRVDELAGAAEQKAGDIGGKVGRQAAEFRK